MAIRVRKILRRTSEPPQKPASGEVARLKKRPEGRPPAPAPRTRMVTAPPSKMKLGPVLLDPSALGVEGIRRRAMTIAEMTWLEVLGLREGADDAAAREAYERMRKLWDPHALPADLARAKADVEVIAAHIENAFAMLAPKPAQLVTSAKPAPTRATKDTVETNAPTRIFVRPRVHDTLVDLHSLIVAEDGAEGS